MEILTDEEYEKQKAENELFHKQVIENGGTITKTVIEEKGQTTTIVTIKENTGKTYGTIVTQNEEGLHVTSF